MYLKRAGLALIALLAAAALAFAGCGDDDDENGGGGAGAEGERVTINLGILPLAALAPVYMGMEQGFFEEENIDLQPQLAQGGAAIVPAVVSGDFQFGYSNNVSLLLATSQGVPLQIVTEGNQAADDAASATDAVVVRGDSDIREPADLAGKTIGVNTLKNVGEVTIKTALEERGVDVSNLEFVEIDFPEMVPAVEAGRVDAGWVVEPFVQAARAQDMRVIINPFFDTAERLSIATYFTSDQYAEQNPDVVERFQRAMNRSLEYAQANQEQIRESVLEFTQIPPPVAEQMNLPFFSPDINVESIDFTADQMVKYNLVDEKPNLDELIPEDLR